MRKRWTPQEDITPELLKFREKRKWAINLRRYVIEEARCPSYAPFFGLDINSFREWIELQFDGGNNWETFGTSWQFDHIVPVDYFDFNSEDDMRLCWNFTNIRVKKLEATDEQGTRIDAIAAKSYFNQLFLTTGLAICKNMVEKIEKIEAAQIVSNKKVEEFIISRKPDLEIARDFTTAEFEKLNQGLTVKEIEKEREFLKKFK